jgi:hypothetical protein
MDLLTTYAHVSELQAITASLLISTIHKSPLHPLSFRQPTVFTSRSLETASNSGDSSAWRSQVLSFQHPVQNSTNNQLRPLLKTSRHEPHRKHSSIVAYSLQRKLVYWVVAQKRSLFWESLLSTGWNLGPVFWQTFSWLFLSSFKQTPGYYRKLGHDIFPKSFPICY